MQRSSNKNSNTRKQSAALPTALVSVPAAAVAAEITAGDDEDQWQQELRDLEEAEKWEKSAENIPDEIRESFQTFLAKLPAANRPRIYILMLTLEWNLDRLRELYSVYTRVPLQSVMPLADLMQSFMPFNLLPVVLDVFYHLRDFQVQTLLFEIDRAEVHYLIQVARHLPKDGKDRQLMINMIDSLSCQEILHMLHHCDEPIAKQCRLCKMKKMKDLEHRMLHGQIPDGMIKVPGVLPLVDNQPSMWAASDEQGFTFDLETGKIFYFREEVDLVRICEKCLSSVNQSITNDGRFEELHHINPVERKEMFGKLRQRERSLAEIIYKVAHERKNRRARDFALRALEMQRHGVRVEKDEEEKRQALEQRKIQLALKEKEHREMIKAAMDVDSKWRAEDRAADIKRLDVRMHLTHVETHLGFGNEHNPRAPMLRKKATSWKLHHYDEHGHALTKQGSMQSFGLHEEDEEDEEEHQLRIWKEEAAEGHARYLARMEAERVEERRRKEQVQYNMHLHSTGTGSTQHNLQCFFLFISKRKPVYKHAFYSF